MTKEQPVQIVRSRWPRFAPRASVVICGAVVALAVGLPGPALASSNCTPTPRRFPIEQDPGTAEPLPAHGPQPVRQPLPSLPCTNEPPSVPTEAVPPAVATVLTGMAAQAAVVFVGRVQLIDREDAHGYVDISFEVQSVVRGTSAAVYVLREWAGLWTWQQDRYHAGERVLLLLHPRSSSGFSSPVGGVDGALPLIGGNQPPILHNGMVPADTAATASALDLTNTRVDLRWIAARAVRTVAAGPQSAGAEQQDALETAAPVPFPPGYRSSPGEAPGPIIPTGPITASAKNDPQGVALGAVLALIGSAAGTFTDAR